MESGTKKRNRFLTEHEKGGKVSQEEEGEEEEEDQERVGRHGKGEERMVMAFGNLRKREWKRSV